MALALPVALCVCSISSEAAFPRTPPQGRDSALLDLLLQAQQRRQPVLIGTGTVEESAQVYHLIRRKLAYWQE